MDRDKDKLIPRTPDKESELKRAEIDSGIRSWLDEWFRPDGTIAPPIPKTRPARKTGLSTSQLLNLFLQSLLLVSETSDEGKIIEAVTLPWFDILELLKKDPKAAFQIPPDKWEEIIAGAYHRL